MLASQAALCESTGSREMSVFHTLLAGNSGQLAAPGTVVPAGVTDTAGVTGGAGTAIVRRTAPSWPRVRAGTVRAGRGRGGAALGQADGGQRGHRRPGEHQPGGLQSKPSHAGILARRCRPCPDIRRLAGPADPCGGCLMMPATQPGGGG